MTSEIVIHSVREMMASQELMEVLPEELDDADVLLVWSIFDAMEKELIKKRKDSFRKRLLELATVKGIENAKGSFEYAPPGTDGKVTRQRRKGKAKLDPVEAELLLEGKNLAGQLMAGEVKLTLGQTQLLLEIVEHHVQDLFHDDADKNEIQESQVLLKDLMAVLQELEIDEKKFEAAVEMGMITVDELKSVSVVGEPTWALVVKKPSVITKLLKGGKK